MPGTLRVRVIAARDLPVMDRASETADAFVEMKFGQTAYKTEIYPKSLNPQWMSDWFTFEADDEELQDECLQFRVMDYDTYSANDAIGRVYLDLNPLLSKNGPSEIAGWLPIYDPMHGIRGELSVVVKIELFTDINIFRQSSCGVEVFATPGIPSGYQLIALHGLVEELLANDDPEYQWIDKIRTPRASNEARQVLFSQMAGQLIRRMGRKVLEMGGNAIVGYRQCFDLEGETGVVARGLGTGVTLEKTTEPCLLGSPGTPDIGQEASGHLWQMPLAEVDEQSTNNGGSVRKLSVSKPQQITPQRRTTSTAATSCESASSAGVTILADGETDANVIPSTQPIVHCAVGAGLPCSAPTDFLAGPASVPKVAPIGSELPPHVPLGSSKTPGLRQPTGLARLLETMEYPFFTMQIYPVGFITHLGSAVCARSVKLLSVIESPDEADLRHSWWQELRNEVRSHMRAMACNGVVGYCEQASVFKDVCILSAMGTAAVIDISMSIAQAQSAHACTDPVQHQARVQSQHLSTVQNVPSTLLDNAGGLSRDKLLRIDTNLANRYSSSVRTVSLSQEPSLCCSACHIPYSENSLPFPVKLSPCACCGNGFVPNILLTTIDPFAELGVSGDFALIQARVVRRKQDSSGETLANELSDMLPFIEHELHSQLVSKLVTAGKNAIYGLRTHISLGENHAVVLATGTAVCLSPMDATKTAASIRQRTSSSVDAEECQKQTQSKIGKVVLQPSNSPLPTGNSARMGQNENRSSASAPVGRPSLDLAWDRNAVVAELGQEPKIDPNAGTSGRLETNLPKGFYCCNTYFLPNISDWNAGDMHQLQLFVRLSQGPIQTPDDFDTNFLSDRINWLVKSTCFKFRNMKPICLASVDCEVDFPQDDVYQISIIGMALTGNAQSPHLAKICHEQMTTGISRGRGGQSDVGELRMDKSVGDHPAAAHPRSQSLGLNTDHGDQLSFSCPASAFQQMLGASSLRKRRMSAAEETPAVKSRQIFVTPLVSPGHAPIAHYLGHYDFFFVRETTALREAGGLESFTQTALTEVLYVVQAHVAAFGGHGMVAFRFTQIAVSHNSNRNQAQCLVGVAGDIVTTMAVGGSLT